MEVRVYIKRRTLTILMARRGWVQADLARAMGASQATVSLILREKVQPSTPMARRLMDAFKGVSYRSGRLKWDDMFNAVYVDSQGASAL